MDDSTFSGSDFESAASATASPEASAADPQIAGTDSSAQPAGTATTDPATTAQAATATTVSEKPKGPIPFDVHETALKNARAKERDAAIAEWRQQHGWAEQADRAAIEEAQRLGQLYQRDRAGYIRAIVSEALSDPELSPQIRSLAGGVLAGGRGPQAPTFEPDIPVYDERGQMVAQTFSAGKVQDLVKHAVAEALGQEVGPIKDRIKRADDAAKAAAAERALDDEADRVTATIAKLPHFAEHEAAIAEAIGQMPPGVDYREAGLLAYINVVLPQLSTTERKRVLADINQKPSASTVSPSSGTTAIPKPDSEKSWEELLEEKAGQFIGGR